MAPSSPPAPSAARIAPQAIDPPPWLNMVAPITRNGEKVNNCASPPWATTVHSQRRSRKPCQPLASPTRIGSGSAFSAGCGFSLTRHNRLIA